MKRFVAFAFLFIFLATPVSAAEFEKNLRFGQTKSSEVMKLQEFLTDQGLYIGPITGNFFSLTLKSVKAFQTAQKVIATGYFGPLTRQKANDVIELALADSDKESENEPAVVAPKSTDDVVTKLNDQLAASKLQADQLAQQLASQTQILGQQSQLLSNIVSNTTPVVQEVAKVAEPVFQPTVWGKEYWDWGRVDYFRYPKASSVKFTFSRFSPGTTISVTYGDVTKSIQGNNLGQEIWFENIDFVDKIYTITVAFSGNDVGSWTWNDRPASQI